VRDKRPRRLLIAAAVAALSTIGGLTVATTNTANAVAPVVQIPQARGANALCLNRQGGGVVFGTHILGWSCDDPNDDFQRFQLDRMCNNGWVSSTCPFNVGSGLNNLYLNSAIVREERSEPPPGTFGLCVGSTQGFSGAIYTNCPRTDGSCSVYTGECWGTIMVLPQVKCCDFARDGGDVSYTVDRYWTNQTNAKRWQCVYARGNQVTLASGSGDAGYCEWYEKFTPL
jgi:hypothetical protein